MRIIKQLVASAAMVSMLMPMGLLAAETDNQNPWTSFEVARDSVNWRLEAYKVGLNLVAWTEVSTDNQNRKLSVWDGVSSRVLATIPVSTWDVPSNDEAFYDEVLGAFDVADGKVVWLQNDGNDREVYGWSGADVYRVSDNAYDDRHPVTSGGQVVWSSYPTDGKYNLMHKDASGWRVLASWHVLNYAFSGNNLYWQNKKNNDAYFSVFVSRDGRTVSAIGKGDDRPITDYFRVDGKGSSAWEYSTKQWSYDKRSVFVSDGGNIAYQAIQRDVPPLETSLEDVYGGRVLVGVKDWNYQNLLERAQLYQIYGSNLETMRRKPELGKALFMDGGVVMHMEIATTEGNSSLIFRGFGGGEEYLGLEPVYRDRFDADGAVAAGARVDSGVVAFANGETDVIPTVSPVVDIKVSGGDIAWIEGGTGNRSLHYATRKVLVAAAGQSGTYTSGYLAREQGSNAVYLMSTNGLRYGFASEAQYKSWYPDFKSVLVLPASRIASYQIGGTVMTKPGATLLKSKDAAQVYVVGADGKLHWILNSAVLDEAVGPYWNQKIDTVSPTVIASYLKGESIGTAWQYNGVVNGIIK